MRARQFADHVELIQKNALKAVKTVKQNNSQCFKINRHFNLAASIHIIGHTIAQTSSFSTDPPPPPYFQSIITRIFRQFNKDQYCT